MTLDTVTFFSANNEQHSPITLALSSVLLPTLSSTLFVFTKKNRSCRYGRGNWYSKTQVETNPIFTITHLFPSHFQTTRILPFLISLCGRIIALSHQPFIHYIPLFTLFQPPHNHAGSSVKLPHDSQMADIYFFDVKHNVSEHIVESRFTVRRLTEICRI